MKKKLARNHIQVKLYQLLHDTRYDAELASDEEQKLSKTNKNNIKAKMSVLYNCVTFTCGDLKTYKFKKKSISKPPLSIITNRDCLQHKSICIQLTVPALIPVS